MAPINAEDVQNAVNNKNFLNTALAQYLNRLNFKDGSEVGGHIDSELRSILVDQDTLRKKKPATFLSVCLDQEQKVAIERYFPELRIQYSESSHSDHPFANAMRTCINSLFYNNCIGQKTIDIGGSLPMHLLNRHMDVHVCNPILSGKDVSRRNSELTQMYRLLNNEEAMKDISLNGSVTSCTSCQSEILDCQYSADIAFMVDVYDISLPDLCEAMVRRDIKQTYIALMLPVELLEKTGSIILRDTNCVVSWSEYWIAHNRVEYFINGHGDQYVHRLDYLRQYLNTGRITASNGACFQLILESVRGDYKIFSLVRTASNLPVAAPVRRYKSTLHGMYKLTIPVDIKNSYEVKELYIDEDFVGRIKSYLVNTVTSTNERNFEYAMSGFRSQRTHLVVGSRVIHNRVELDPNEIPVIVGVLLRDAVISKDEAMIASRITSFESWGCFTWLKFLLGKLVEWFGGCWKVFFTLVIKLVASKYFKFLQAINKPVEKVMPDVDVPLKGTDIFSDWHSDAYDHKREFKNIVSGLSRDMVNKSNERLMKTLTDVLSKKADPEVLLKELVNLDRPVKDIQELLAVVEKVAKNASEKSVNSSVEKLERTNPEVLEAGVKSIMEKPELTLGDLEKLNRNLNEKKSVSAIYDEEDGIVDGFINLLEKERKGKMVAETVTVVDSTESSDDSDTDNVSAGGVTEDASSDGPLCWDKDKAADKLFENLIEDEVRPSSYDKFAACLISGCDWVTSAKPHLNLRRGSRCPSRSLPAELGEASVVEFLLHTSAGCYDLFEKYLKLAGQKERIRKGVAVTKECKDSFKSLNIFLRTDRFIYIDGEKVSPAQAFCVYDTEEERFVSAEDMINGNSPGRKYACCDDLYKSIGFRLLSAAVCVSKAADIDEKFKTLNVRLENTPPGGGKTTRLVDEYMKAPHLNLIVTANAGSAEDINLEIAKRRKKNKQRVARTADSRLMNWVGLQPMSVVRIDECFLMHYGQLKLVSFISRAENVVLYGDENQIPFINRLQAFRCKSELLNSDGVVTNNLDGSYRCPGDVCWYLSTLKNDKGNLCYKNGVKKLNDKRGWRSVSKTPILSYEDVPLEGFDCYITYTQMEKAELKSTFFKNKKKLKVMTVHESQGKTFGNVAVVRCKPADDIVFDSLGHHIVVISRHTESMKYFCLSRKMGDRLSKAVGSMETVKDEVLKGRNFSTMRCVYTPSPSLLVFEKPPESKVSRSHLNSLNYFLEDTVAGSTGLDFYHREDCVEFEDFDVNLDNVVIKENEKRIIRSPDSMTVPVVRSQIGSKKRDSLRSNMLVFESRNQNADRGVNVCTSEIVSEQIVDNFFNKLVDQRKLSEVLDDPIEMNLQTLDEWLASRNSQGYSSLLRDLSEGTDVESNLTNFKLMVKSDAKPKLDDSVISKLAIGQNIVYHKRKINAVFSNVFIQVFERLKHVLSSNVVLYNKMSLDEFASEVHSRVGTDIDSYFCGELDISKYDKSQGPLFKQVEEKVLARLGVNPEILNLWYASEYESSVSTSSGSFSADVSAQRRSGASNTWLGNTIINMCLQAYCTNFDDVACACFSGDDSLLLSLTPLEDCYSDLSVLFGFDIKFIKHSTPYFCSKYVISDGTKLYFVPDPYKLLVKLGRIVGSDQNKIHEIFTSFCDITKDYGSETVVDKLCEYHTRKYNFSPFSYAAFAAIHCIRANFSQFSRLYISKSKGAFGFSLRD
ncbi:replication-associated polyprotein [Citrus associated ampelovirus 2]|nr:replication-associated polyprotein [Citrus associated ampelovirus 2]